MHRAKVARDQQAIRSFAAGVELELRALEDAHLEPNLAGDIRAIRRVVDRMRGKLEG